MHAVRRRDITTRMDIITFLTTTSTFLTLVAAALVQPELVAAAPVRAAPVRAAPVRAAPVRAAPVRVEPELAAAAPVIKIENL